MTRVVMVDASTVGGKFFMINARLLGGWFGIGCISRCRGFYVRTPESTYSFPAKRMDSTRPYYEMCLGWLMIGFWPHGRLEDE